MPIQSTGPHTRELHGDGDVGSTAVTAVLLWYGDALNVEHRGVCGDGDRLHGSTTGAILLFAVTPW